MAKTDMMDHYNSIKEQYPDCIIFYRLGDFYEMFNDDAVEASQILDLTLTGRGKGENRAPMCGVPYHAAEEYIAKLVSAGKKVAICEQLTAPGDQKGLLVRDVIRVVSNGTMIDSEQVDEKSNNFLASYSVTPEGTAIAWADITTGDFFVQEVADKDVLNAFYRIDPAEIVLNGKAFSHFNAFPDPVKTSFKRISPYADSHFSYRNALKTLLEKFNVLNLDAYLPEGKLASVCAAGALIDYLNETQRHALKNITKLSYYDECEYLILDNVARRNLEIVSSMRDGKIYGTLLWAVDRTKTAGGAREMRTILTSPLKDKDAINYRLDGVSDLFDDSRGREGIIDTLKGVKDLERLVGRVSNNIVTPRDCKNIQTTLEAIPAIKFRLSGRKAKVLNDVAENLGDFTELARVIDKIITDNPPVSTKGGGFIRAGFDKQLDEYRDIRDNAKKIIEDMETREREATGIRTLKISFNKVFGFYIEVSKSFVEQVPYSYVRKQTLVNAERYTTPELKDFEEKYLTSDENAVRIENEIYNKLKVVLSENIQKLLITAKAFSLLDVLCSFALVAKKYNYSRPEIIESGLALDIVGGRHPVIEQAGKESFIPNDALLDNEENRMLIITGPNMAGKSTYMRQIALITVLAHCGSFVPARSASIPITDRIFTRVGASDNLVFGQSTFMVEMAEVANILNNATKNSLLVMDEVGRGTSTYDGLSIAWAVVEHIAKITRAKTLFATHYHELSELEGVVDGVKNYKITVRELNGGIVFLRKIARGSANKSFGIEVASLAGIQESITKRAKTILRSLEKRDVACGNLPEVEESETISRSYADEYIKDLDINNLTPMKALEILSYLKEKENEQT